MSKQTSYFKQTSKSNIIIPFDELTGHDISYLNTFHLSRKRTYCNLSSEIVKVANIIASYDEEGKLLFDILYLKTLISKTDNYSVQAFTSDLYEHLIDKPYLLDIIDKHVEENYIMNLDSKTDQRKQKNESLMYTDEHCKILVKISFLQRFIIPLVMEYINQNYTAVITKDYKVDHYLLDVMDKLFDGNYFVKNKRISITHKLFESVKSKVQATTYSDKTIWTYYQYTGESEDTYIEYLYKKILTDIVPKFDIDQNLVTYTNVVIKNSIDAYFRSNRPVNFTTKTVVKENADDQSNFDRMEVTNAKVDESEIVINKNNLLLTLERMCKEENIEITKEEMEFYRDNVEFNKIQCNILFLFFAKRFGGTKPLFNSSRTEYARLIIIFKRLLERNNFIYLQEFISGRIINKINEKRTINKKQLLKIIESEKFEYIVKEKFSSVHDLVVESKIIERYIATLLNTKFAYLDFDNTERNGEEIKANADILSEEILRFLEMI